MLDRIIAELFVWRRWQAHAICLLLMPCGISSKISWANQWHFCIVFPCAFSSITVVNKTRYLVLVTWSVFLGLSLLSSRPVTKASTVFYEICPDTYSAVLFKKRIPFFPSCFVFFPPLSSSFPCLSLSSLVSYCTSAQYSQHTWTICPWKEWALLPLIPFTNQVVWLHHVFSELWIMLLFSPCCIRKCYCSSQQSFKTKLAFLA